MNASAGSLFRPRRELGRTGFRATRLGIGDLADRQLPRETLVATLRRALDAGLNLIDTAPMYEDGYSEELVGAALAGRREGIFVIDKVDQLDEPVAPQVEASLKRLNLEATDLFVLHALDGIENWRRLSAPGGAVQQLSECMQAGKCRFRGISSHDPEVLRAAVESGTCDVLLFPVGAYADERFAGDVLPLARSRGVGTVGFKVFGAGKLLGDTEGYNQPLKARPRGKVGSGGTSAPGEPCSESGSALLQGEPRLPHLSVEDCLAYTLTCDPDVALLGLSYPNEQDAAFAAFRGFQPLAPAAMVDIRRRAAEAIKGKGRVWWNPK